MPKVSRESAPNVGRMGPVEDRNQTLGEYTVNFTSFSEDIDGTPLLKGLPDDRCDCPHWGYVFSGSVTLRFADHDEVYEAGDAFFAPPGHAPLATAGTEYLQFSPAHKLAHVAEVMAGNMQAMMGA